MLEPPDHECGNPNGLLSESERRGRLDERAQAYLELDPGQRGADADVDTTPEADVLVCVLELRFPGC
jgi:hypothetical protein